MTRRNIENITQSDSNLAQTFDGYHILPEITFNGYCLIKNNISLSIKVINLYISYTLTSW